MWIALPITARVRMNKKLSHYPWFWGSILLPVILALIFSGIIIYNEDLEPCGTSECFRTFVEIFRVPLAVAALAFPGSAWVIASHRSALTLKQITETESQNKFANYFKHREEFFKHIEALELPFRLNSNGNFHFLDLVHLHITYYGDLKSFHVHSESLDSFRLNFCIRDVFDDLTELVRSEGTSGLSDFTDNAIRLHTILGESFGIVFYPAVKRNTIAIADGMDNQHEYEFIGDLAISINMTVWDFRTSVDTVTRYIDSVLKFSGDKLDVDIYGLWSDRFNDDDIQKLRLLNLSKLLTKQMMNA